MAKEMLINVSEGEECRIALLENNRLDEFYIERTSSTSHVGNIYKGKVVNVEPSIQAAFIDFGLGRNGFLHISDLLPTYFGRQGEDYTESVGRKLARRDRPPIQRCLRRGDELIVQIIKEGIGTKGPTLTTYLSIPGRILVMMPGMTQMGVSRKIEDEAERRRLRQILDSLDPADDCAFIIRTAGVGKPKADIQRDLAYLTRLWQQINKDIKTGVCPMELYTEGDLVTRTVRDVFTNEVENIIVDNADVARRVRDFIKLTSPRAKDKVELYQDPIPLLHKYGIEKEIEMMYSRHVPLPSGGSLVIDQTEAVVAIDVNSGKFREHSDAETTAFKTDMEAADEIPRQLKLRDLGGVIICDFIDLRYERHRHELENKLQQNFKNDRAKTKVLRMSQFGIIELTRQRMRPSIKKSIYYDCPHCRGSGLVKTPESMSLDVMRKLAIATHDQRVVRVEVTVHNDVAGFLNNRKRRQLANLEQQTGKRILIKSGMQMGIDEVRVDLLDVRDGLVTIPELFAAIPQTIQEAQQMAKSSGRPQEHREDRRGDRRDRSGRRPRREQQHDEREGMDELEEAAEQTANIEAPKEQEEFQPADYEQQEQQYPVEEQEPQEQGEPQEQQHQVRQPGTSAPSNQRYQPGMGQNQAQGFSHRPGGGEQNRDLQGEGRGRRRRRRGRGRGGRYEDQQYQPQQEQGNIAHAAEPTEDLLKRLPSNIWIAMPEDIAAQTDIQKPQTPATPVEPAKFIPPVREQQPVRIAPIGPVSPVRVAPIAEGPAVVVKKEPVVVKMEAARPIPVARPAVIEEEKRKVTIQDAPVREEAKPAKALRASKAPKKGAKPATKAKAKKTAKAPKKTKVIESRGAQVRIAEDTTASAALVDKHLADDEPVAEIESVPRPKTARDMDIVPEEME